MNVAQAHQLRIARETLRLSDAGSRLLGGMTKEEARQIIAAYAASSSSSSSSPKRGKRK